VHALSRCQMILTEAKKRAQREYAAALGRAGLGPEQARARLAARPALRRAAARLPRRGAVGTAASLVLELGAVR
jgi:hypothetical protein